MPTKKKRHQRTFDERLTDIDRGHKLLAAEAATRAQQNNAIAAIWHSHWRQAGYDYRPEHKERDGKIYLIRNSWAEQEGLVKPGPAGYADEITQPAEEFHCCPVPTIRN